MSQFAMNNSAFVFIKVILFILHWLFFEEIVFHNLAGRKYYCSAATGQKYSRKQGNVNI